MPKLEDLFATIAERIRVSARAETIYGETRVVDGRSIIPVGKLRYGFGAGAGEREVERDGREVETEGGGGGGGVAVTPVGFLVVSAEGEKFVPVRPAARDLAVAALAGFVVGWALARRARPR